MSPISSDPHRIDLGLVRETGSHRAQGIGRPLLGVRGFGGEIGHMKLDPSGPLCGCGRRGCWEALIGLGALLRTVSPGGPGGPERPGGSDGEPPEVKAGAVARLARAGDAQVLDALATLGRWVGIGAANLANVFNPRAIILGGYFTLLAEWILPPATKALHDGVLAPEAGGCKLTTSSLGFSAAARGGAIHVADQIISNPALLVTLGGATPAWAGPGGPRPTYATRPADE